MTETPVIIVEGRGVPEDGAYAHGVGARRCAYNNRCLEGLRRERRIPARGSDRDANCAPCSRVKALPDDAIEPVSLLLSRRNLPTGRRSTFQIALDSLTLLQGCLSSARGSDSMPNPLPLLGEAPASRVPHALPLLASGFRPFFLLGSMFSVVVLPLWLLAQVGTFHPDPYLNPTYWHAHEMVFGFAVAVIAGFLLTAVGNWTSRETVVGWPLLALSTLWTLGRVALMLAGRLPRWLPPAIDLAFLPALLVGIGRPIVAVRMWRHAPILLVLLLLWLANVAVHLGAVGVLPGGQRSGSLVAVDLVVIVILVISGRVFPMFTRNATHVSSIRSVPVFDALAIGSMVLLAVVDAFLEDPRIAAYVAGATSVFAAARCVHWGARHSLRIPLLWILHVGYGWIPVGLALRTAAAFDGRIASVLGTHALTIGAIGGLTLGMMSRVALGHTGRALVATKPLAYAFMLLTIAAFVRVFVPLLHVAWYQASIFMSGTLWTAAFGLFLVVYFPVLISPRVDGKPG
jgi:uncharacterized protein involved in response to NO